MPNTFNKILIADDDQDVLLAARLLLKPHAERIHTETDPHLIPTLLQNGTYDVILLDMNFAQDATSGKEGIYWLKRILDLDPSAVVILITAYGGVETAVQAIKEGATDFVLKPWQNEKLLATLSAAARLRRSQLQVDSFLKTYGKKYNKAGIRIQQTALDQLKTYAWPGNIRELQHAIERAIIMSDGRALGPDDFLRSRACSSA